MKCSFVLYFLIFFLNSPQNDDWKLEKDKDGVKVYTRFPPGEKYKEFRAITTLEGTISNAVALLGDIQVASDWYAHVKQASVLEKYNSRQSIVHIELNLPFPADDRDMIAFFDFRHDPETGVVEATVTGNPDYAPPLEKSIRILRLNGSWKFIPLDDNKVEVQYQLFSDPRGNLPAWIVNIFIVDDPFRSLRNMQQFVKLEKYRNATFDFIPSKK